MRSFNVTAQSYTTIQRIVKQVTAVSEADLLRTISNKLDAAGFYVIDIKLIVT